MLLEMPLLVGAIAGVLVLKQSVARCAIDSLAAIGTLDTKLGVSLLLATLYYNNIFSTKDIKFHDISVSFFIIFSFFFWFPSFITLLFVRRHINICSHLTKLIGLLRYDDDDINNLLQLKLLGLLPSLASHTLMTPLVVQTILPMLSKDVKPYVLSIILAVFNLYMLSGEDKLNIPYKLE